MQKTVHFRVDPKLAHVLGESYANSEKALKELVDNAWDVEATEVHVTVPTILTDAPIIVQDNGSGMKTAELEAEYLNIASPRFSRKGDRTPNLNRTVKGRKGIGKFAGLILARKQRKKSEGRMQKGSTSSFIPHTSSFSQLSHIQPDKLKELLALDYGREPSFVIFVNGERVFHHDIQGEKFQTEITLPTNQMRRKNDECRTRPERPHQAVCIAHHPLVRKPAENDRSSGPGQTSAPFRHLRGGELSRSPSWPQQSRVHREMWRLPQRTSVVRVI